MSLLDLVGGSQVKATVAVVAVALVLAAVGGVVWKFNSMSHEIDKLEQDKSGLMASNKILQQNVETVKENIKTVSESNAENLKTIKALMDERAPAQRAIGALAASELSNKNTILKLNEKLAKMITDPSNDGPVAPALKETVRDIQNSRK